MPKSSKPKVTWNGKKILANVERAAKHSMNVLMSRCVIQAKRNHPNWQNRTGTAEGSVTIVQYATPIGKRIYGAWGSVGAHYAIYLEARHGPWMRAAADTIYPQFTKIFIASVNSSGGIAS